MPSTIQPAPGPLYTVNPGKAASLCFLALFFPPMAVACVDGCGLSIGINFLLTLLGWLPGMFHAYYVVSKHVAVSNQFAGQVLSKTERAEVPMQLRPQPHVQLSSPQHHYTTSQMEARISPINSPHSSTAPTQSLPFAMAQTNGGRAFGQAPPYERGPYEREMNMDHKDRMVIKTN